MNRKNSRIILLIFGFVLLFMTSSFSTAEEVDEEVSESRKYLGEAVYAGKSEGYTKSEKIDEDNPHYGWKLGDFYIEGFTRVSDESDNPIILKNVGDKVKLSFTLLQDIDKLNGKEEITIASDENGYDEEFGIKKTDFGQGMLIIQKTNYQGQKEEPVLYKNYLAGVKKKAETEVELCEEGDYEVSLDYKISVEKKGLEKAIFWAQSEYDFKIHFKFSVRNGNCMVYPFDVKTKAELTNTSITPNGFYLDFAKSRYIDVDIKKQILNKGGSGLVEDTRFNKPAADGEKFTDEGVYIITASNKYTDQTTEKTIYVGDNDILKAYATTGLSIGEIQKQVDNGAIVNDEGIISYENTNNTTTVDVTTNPGDGININVDVGDAKGIFSKIISFAKENPIPVLIIVIVSLIIIVVLIVIIKKKINDIKEDFRIRRNQRLRMKENRRHERERLREEKRRKKMDK